MPVQHSSAATRVPDQVSDLAIDLAAVDVSQHTPLVFGDLSHIAMDRNPSEPHTLETLTAQVKVNYDKAQLETGKLKETMGNMLQDVAQLHTLHQDLMAAMTELKQSTAALATAKAGRPPGPTHSEGVAEALRDPAARQEATKTYGIQWLTETKEKEMWPADALKDDQFMARYYQLRLSGTAGPSASPLSTASTIADLLASVVRPATVLGKAASDSLPGSIATPSTASTAFPFSAAIAGKHVEVDLPKPSKFSRIAVDSDIRAWLLRMHEYLTISGIEPSVWVVFASNYLDKAPLQLWEARKTQLSNQPELLYSWDHFRKWCLASFSVHDHETHAISQLEKLRQTDSVAEYRAAHDVLAAQTTLPMKLRLFWWERGLKDEIRVMCSLDPLTHKQYADIEAAQNAACACDAHLSSASAVATAIEPATHTDLHDANFDDESDGDELPVTKRPCLTYNRHEKCRCFNCGRFGHIARACPGHKEMQDKAPTRDHIQQSEANERPVSTKDGNTNH